MPRLSDAGSIVLSVVGSVAVAMVGALVMMDSAPIGEAWAQSQARDPDASLGLGDAVSMLRQKAGIDWWLEPSCNEKPLLLQVIIDTDGMQVQSVQPSGPMTIRSISYDDEEQGKSGLAEAAEDVKRLFPHESSVDIQAEPGTPMSTIADAVVAMRGEGCWMSDDLEELEADCLFWAPAVNIPDEARPSLALHLIARGVEPWEAVWSSVDHLAEWRSMGPARGCVQRDRHRR